MTFVFCAAWVTFASSKLSFDVLMLSSILCRTVQVSVIPLLISELWSGGDGIVRSRGITLGDCPIISWNLEKPVYVLIVFILLKQIHRRVHTQPS